MSAQELIDEILLQEQELQFTKFTSEDALQLGLLILDNVKKNYKKSVAIDITVNNLQLFRHMMDGATLDNENWIRRKSNSVKWFGHSSYWLGNTLQVKGKTIEEAYLLSGKDYASHGGSFPIIIKDVAGIVGHITVTGLKQWEDHGVIVDSIRQYLSK
ncbi:unnamed protein product [Cunninghamella echinulata]